MSYSAMATTRKTCSEFYKESCDGRQMGNAAGLPSLLSHAAYRRKAARNEICACERPLMRYQRGTAWLATAAAGAATFLLLAGLVRVDGTTGVDQAVYAWLTDHRTQLRTTVALEITALANGAVVAVLAVVAALLVRRGRRPELAAVPLVAVPAALIVNYGAKAVFGRDRPDLVEWLTQAGHAAFPSGHALYAAATYLSLAVVVTVGVHASWAKLIVWIGAATLIVAVGLSRIYLGVHWPSDVLAGWALGVAVAAGTLAVVQRRHSSAR